MQQVFIIRDSSGNISGLSANAGDGAIAASIDDPDVQASLKQLSLSENADKTTRIHTVDSVKNIVEAAIHAATKQIHDTYKAKDLKAFVACFDEDYETWTGTTKI